MYRPTVRYDDIYYGELRITVMAGAEAKRIGEREGRQQWQIENIQ
ncbi:hypothetical protein [Alkalihalobacillus sp. 1P02AB]